MHVITYRRLREFWAEHPDAENSPRAWYKVAKRAEWANFAAVRASFASADAVGRLVVFNVGGNKYRLIAAIHHNTGKIYVRHVLTHREYDAGKWKEG